ncbi:outer membrane protein [Pararhodobacter oceanensis]|uniref:Outer membrane protein beta-barrel domain-containing protein n=1 Tax=Pararhodobacter oceanensis TaxID=2172121 RepID=A0A2T8HWB1_9RHOB|nr:outer membrane beta-barrel protein [Pararhodobacter oceanensis]PVH29726.1 hypothetical protein DDE20_06345 [Pararhodobacter oceanensis]
MKFSLSLSTAVATTLATAATASGPIDVAPPPVVYQMPAAYDWSGTYFGAAIGYSRGTYRLGVSALNQLGPNVEISGATGAAFLGRNWQSGSTVFGVEFDASTGANGITPQGTAGPFWSCNTGNCNVNIDSLFTLRGRVGVAQNNWLIYGTGGIAHANVSGGILNSAQQGSGSATGYVVGLGAEYGLSARSSVRLEYLHYDLGALPFGTGSLPTDRFDGVGDFGTLRLGYSMRF